MSISRAALPFALAVSLSGCDFPLFQGGDSDIDGMGSNVIIYEEPTPTYTYVDYAKFVIVGDSLMDEWNPWTELPWMTSKLIEREEERPVLNISLGGQRLQAAVDDGVAGAINYYTGHGRHSPIAVFVELAHNDWAFAKTDLNQFYDNYVEFLGDIEDGNNVVDVFCIVPVLAKHDYEHPINKHGESYDDVRDTVRRVAETGLCDIVETADWFYFEDVYDAEHFPDGLHLGSAGHRKYKDGMMTAIGRGPAKTTLSQPMVK